MSELESYVAAARAESRSHQFLTAAAIGLASLSIAPALHAEIVYTPTNQSIGKSIFGEGAYSTLQVDLNNDGVPDFTLSAYNLLSFSSGFLIVHAVGAAGLQSNQILANNAGLALAGLSGQRVGFPLNARSQFRKDGEMAQSLRAGLSHTTFHTSAGYWFNVDNRYLGIKWARLNASPGHATLTGYAYETEPNKPIPAGVLPTPESDAALHKPATLGVLAMGAVRP